MIGIRTELVKKVCLATGDEAVRLNYQVPTGASKFILAGGLIRPLRMVEQTSQQIEEAIRVNLIEPVRWCDAILSTVPNARIVVIGSESGIKWSYDDVYAAGKAALHQYVRTKETGPNQLLACVVPGIIEDSGMTLRRDDKERVAQRGKDHPKKRNVLTEEVAETVRWLLYDASVFLSNSVVDMRGRPTC